MIRRILNILITPFISAIALTAIGIVIWYFMKSSQTSLQDVLFWVGIAPMVWFCIGLIGIYKVRGSFNYLQSRTVSEKSPNQRAVQDEQEMKSLATTRLNWLMAGIFVWIVMFFV